MGSSPILGTRKINKTPLGEFCLFKLTLYTFSCILLAANSLFPSTLNISEITCQKQLATLYCAVVVATL